ncbi:MAG: hypothetical protein NZ870_03070, partial [bacterium]|nr:hypothetical protein [bacterium]
MNEFDTLLSELKDVLLDLTSHELTPKGVNSAIVKEEVVVESPELTTQPHFVEEEVEKIPIVNAVFFYPYKNDLVDEFVSKLNEQIKSTARKQFIINVIKKYEYLDDSFIFSKLEEVKNIAPR